MKVGVIGTGSWGTALAQVLCDNKVDVLIWGRSKDEVDSINNEHKLSYLKDVILNKSLKATNNFSDLAASDVIVMATPTSAIDSVCELINENFKKEIIIVNVAKGFHAKTNERLSVAIKRLIKPEILKEVVSLIGPTHAEEVIIRLETAITAVSEDMEAATLVQKLFANDYFRVYTNTDVIGAEIGAAVKNVIALASGILSGLGLGDNARAALITRGLAEIRRLGSAMNADDQTFFGLTGVGDLIVTATSHHSRNFKAGEEIGRHNSAKYFWDNNKTTVEGARAVKVVMDLAKRYEVSMPISREIYNILYKDQLPSEAINKLMNRKLKSEEIKP